MAIRFERNMTSTIVIMYSLYLNFLGSVLEIHQKHYLYFKISVEVMCLSEIWFNVLNQILFINVKRITAFMILLI